MTQKRKPKSKAKIGRLASWLYVKMLERGEEGFSLSKSDLIEIAKEKKKPPMDILIALNELAAARVIILYLAHGMVLSHLDQFTVLFTIEMLDPIDIVKGKHG